MAGFDPFTPSRKGNLKPKPHWARLPLFDRKGWKTALFGELEVQEELRKTLLNYQPPNDQDLFNKVYALTA